MQDNRQTPGLGPLAVTGASGGVGMLAIDIFTRAGYDVHAISGKADHFDFLRGLGAKECIDRHKLAFNGKPMDSARFGGALDNVGGSMLAGLLPLIVPYGNVAICGNAGGIAFDSTVMPFIIRGVSLWASLPRQLPAISATRCGNIWQATGNPPIWIRFLPRKLRWSSFLRYSSVCWQAILSAAPLCVSARFEIFTLGSVATAP
jgi:NADPH:quinone reductase-like Zn-dependent oxidoreductase